MQCAVDCLIFGIREKPWRYGVGGHNPSKSNISAGKSGDLERVALSGGMERATATDHAGVAEAIAPKPVKNWWDNEPM